MTAYSFNIIFAIYVSFIIHSSHGFKVIQPQNRTVNSDGVASISCEHTASVSSVGDVRLNSISPTDESTTLCQKGKKNCDNIVMHQVNHNKWLFIIFNIRAEDMTKKYQCEITVIINNFDETKEGIPTILLSGEKEVASVQHPPSPPPPPRPTATPPPPPSPPPPLQCQLRWILIGPLTLMFLYSCVITFFYFRLRSSNSDPENSVYVEMRKAPVPRNPPFDIYCG